MTPLSITETSSRVHPALAKPPQQDHQHIPPPPPGWRAHRCIHTKYSPPLHRHFHLHLSVSVSYMLHYHIERNVVCSIKSGFPPIRAAVVSALVVLPRESISCVILRPIAKYPTAKLGPPGLAQVDTDAFADRVLSACHQLMSGKCVWLDFSRDRY